MSERSGTQTWTEWNAEAEHLLESEATLTDAEVAKMERLSRTVFGAVLAMEARRARIREVIERVRADKLEAERDQLRVDLAAVAEKLRVERQYGDQLRAKVERLEKALRALMLEAKGFLSMADPTVHGYTNINVLQHWIDNAGAALAEEGK